MSPDFQIYVTKGHGAQLYHVEMYISYNEYVQGHNQEFFIAVEVFAKKSTICARYYSYIISVIYNTLISVAKANHYITFMIEVLMSF